MPNTVTVRSAIEYFRRKGHKVWVQDAKHTTVCLDGEVMSNNEFLRKAIGVMMRVDS